MHPAFANATVRLDELERELALFIQAEEQRLRSLSEGSEIDRWISKVSRASAIESLYTGMEGVLRAVFDAFGEDVASLRDRLDGHRFHMQLLAQAAVATQERPPVISRNLHADLDELRKFRHVERNAYGFALKADRVADIVGLAVETTRSFSGSVRTFLVEASRGV